MTSVVMWFRRDLRLYDNKALIKCVNLAGDAGSVFPVFCISPSLIERAPLVKLSYLASVLRELDHNLESKLNFIYGDPAIEIPAFAKQVDARTVVATREFSPFGIQVDSKVGDSLRQAGIELILGDSCYLVRPDKIANKTGEPYKVFAPFFTELRRRGYPCPSGMPKLTCIGDRVTYDVRAKEIIELTRQYDADQFVDTERACVEAVDGFRDSQLTDYEANRNLIFEQHTTQLSPALRFGLIHPRQIAERVKDSPGADSLLRSLCWREFFAAITFSQPRSLWNNYNNDFDEFVWDSTENSDVKAKFEAWKSGMTGFPIVDAGMRQLKSTGWIPNRIRMIVASFLVKDLHLDWRLGAKFFLDTLIDGDVASNNQSWQWVGGSGVDCAPYFRIFNPTIQAKKFDPDGKYIKSWIPELRSLAPSMVHEPELGKNVGLLKANAYPARIVDHNIERQTSLSRYAHMRHITKLSQVSEVAVDEAG